MREKEYRSAMVGLGGVVCVSSGQVMRATLLVSWVVGGRGGGDLTEAVVR